jgi:hypothetical protein
MPDQAAAEVEINRVRVTSWGVESFQITPERRRTGAHRYIPWPMYRNPNFSTRSFAVPFGTAGTFGVIPTCGN